MTPREIFAAVETWNRSRASAGGVLLNPLGCTVHWGHETGHFKSRSMMAAWNLAGIKGTKGWFARGGATFGALTVEVFDGKAHRLLGSFRAYPSLEAFLDDYAGILSRCYPLAARSSDCVFLFLAGLVRGRDREGGPPYRWATDPDYFPALCRMVRRYAPEVLGERAPLLLAQSFLAARARGFPEAEMEGPAAEGLP